jgi:hypothetical protein
MTSAAPMAAESTEPAPAPRRIGLRVALIVLAAIEVTIGFSDLPVLFGDTSSLPGPGLGGFLVKAHLAMHPVLALAALVFAGIGRVRYAIIALGIAIVMAWLNEMPSIIARGFEIRSTFSFVETTARIIAFPLIAACAIAYAAHNEHLGRATLLVAVPTLFNVVLVVGFIVGVMIYGF